MYTFSASSVSASSVTRLHALCAVYTRQNVAEMMLDAIGWTTDADLAVSTLLEPCAGDGALLVAAADRLLTSLVNRGVSLARDVLAPRIKAFELHAGAAKTARQRLTSLLCRAGLSSTKAAAIAADWVRIADFLLSDPSPVTHVVANPPYVRWSRLSHDLASAYVRRLGRERARGDLSIAFLHCIADNLALRGRAAVLCTDRWIYSQAGESLRDRLSREFRVTKTEPVDANTAFESEVLAYPIVLVLERGEQNERAPFELVGAGLSTNDRCQARGLLLELQRRHGLIGDAGCCIKVGPALGHEPAFVFAPCEISQVEAELLHPYVKPAEVIVGGIEWRGRRVARLNTEGGGWIQLKAYPKMAAHLELHRVHLADRACVSSRQLWYRTIDPIHLGWTSAPKILVPELSSLPRASLDTVGFVPSHGIYAILSKEWPLSALQTALSGGLLDLVARAVAPILRGRSYRLYRRFLQQLPLPKWDSLDRKQRERLQQPDTSAAEVQAIFRLPVTSPWARRRR